MKTVGKVIIGVGAVLAVGALAAYGLKKLVEKTDLCGCCDCKDHAMCGCNCECHEEKVEKVEAPVEQEVVEKVEENVEAPAEA